MTMTMHEVVGYLNAGVPFTFTPDEVEGFQPFKPKAVRKTIQLGLIAHQVRDLLHKPTGPLGSMEEAKKLYNHVRGYADTTYADKVPRGWKFLGRGGTRACYLSPSGVAYKVCHRYQETLDVPNNNDVEHDNFEFISKSGKLPEGWRVPRTHPYRFEGKFTKWDYKTNDEVQADGFITILAIEYVKGKTFAEMGRRVVNGRRINWSEVITKAFTEVGLDDCYTGNAMMCDMGINWIVDAAESYLDETKEKKYVR